MKSNQVQVINISILFALFLPFSYLMVSTANAIPITNGLVGYWAGEGNAEDSSGYGNHGSLYGDTSFATGLVGQAFRFDGDGDYVTLGKPSFFQESTPALSFTFWTKADSVTEGMTPLFAADTTGGHNQGGFFVAYYQSNQVTVEVYDSPVHAWKPPIILTNARDTQWHHVTVVSEGTDFRAYYDSVYVGSVTLSHNLDMGFTNPMALGVVYQHLGGPHNEMFFQGLTDEVAVYDRALSQEEIKTIYYAGIIPEPSTFFLLGFGSLGLLGYAWRRRRRTA